MNSSQSAKRQLSDVFVDQSIHSNLSERLKPFFLEIVNQERLDEKILHRFEDIYLPLSAWIAEKHTDQPIVIGINGAQGSGKSTLSKILKSLLINGFGKNTLLLSLDDLYYSKKIRKELADTIHPLLQTRGVPGTHDVEMGINLMNAMLDNKIDDVLLPIFDKSIDDLLPKDKWIKVNEPIDIILFEGWCVGSNPQENEELNNSINELEREDDRNHIWRTYVNRQLAGPYQDLFQYIDYLIMMKVPDLESIIEWRTLQESKLKETCKKENDFSDKIMSDDEIKRFIMHFERITKYTLDEMPDRADMVLVLNKKHQVCDVRMKE